jgi:hypothetical protein
MYVKRGGLLFSLLSLMALKSFAQEAAIPLASALDSSASYLINQIPAGAKVLVLDLTTENLILSDYLADEITVRLVNDSNFTIVNRRDLDLDIIRQEMELQISGEVNNVTAARIGQKIGAQSIILSSIEQTQLRIRAIKVETAEIQAIRPYTIRQDALLAVLDGRGTRTNERSKSLSRVLKEASSYLIEKRTSENSKIAVLNIRVKNKALSNYINDNISENLRMSGYFTLVDRDNPDLLQAEIDFQYSGETSEKTTVSIGKKIGAQLILTISIEELGELYRLQICSIEVETATIQAMQNYLIRDNQILSRLTGQEYKKLYLGAMPGFSIHSFDTNGTDYDGTKSSGNFSIDGAFIAEYFITRVFSLQTGLLFTTDTITIGTTESFSTRSLLIPLLAGINFHPSIFVVGFYGGVYLDIPFNGVYNNGFDEDGFDRSLLFGYTAGGSAGIKFGPGIVFLDARYMGDFINAKATVNNSQAETYKRHIIAFGIGYKIGFINQKR